MNRPISDLNEAKEAGIYRVPSEPFEPIPAPSGIRYYKMTGRWRAKGEWLVVRTGEQGLTTWHYLAPMTVGRINYPKDGL